MVHVVHTAGLKMCGKFWSGSLMGGESLDIGDRIILK